VESHYEFCNKGDISICPMIEFIDEKQGSVSYHRGKGATAMGLAAIARLWKSSTG
jgi:hypothetical protein